MEKEHLLKSVLGGTVTYLLVSGTDYFQTNLPTQEATTTNFPAKMFPCLLDIIIMDSPFCRVQIKKGHQDAKNPPICELQRQPFLAGSETSDCVLSCSQDVSPGDLSQIWRGLDGKMNDHEH